MKLKRIQASLLSLTKKEIKACNAFVIAMTQGAIAKQKYWSYLLQKLEKRKLDNSAFEDEIIVKHTGLKNKSTYIAKVNAEILSLIDEFLILQNIRKNKNLFSSLKTETYYKRGLIEQGDILKKQAKKLIHTNPVDLNSAYYELQLELSHLFSEYTDKYKTEQLRIEQCHYYLSQFYARLTCFLNIVVANRQLIYQDNPDKFPEEISINSETAKNDPISKYLTMFEKFISNNLATQQIIGSIIESFSPRNGSIAKILQKPLYVICCNLLAIRIKGDPKNNNSKDLLKLYKYGIESEILIHDEQISVGQLLNIIEIAGIHNEIRWASSFLLNNLRYIQQELRSNASKFGKAIIEYYKGNYFISQSILYHEVKTRNANADLRRRELFLICTYELLDQNNKDFVKNQISSFEKWINEHKLELNDTNRIGSKNMIKFIKLLLSNASIQELEVYRYDVSPIRKRSWIVKKLDQFKNNSK